jgi:hypothetical protein
MELDHLEGPEGRATGFLWFSKGEFAGCCEQGNENVFLNMCGISWVAEELMDIQERLCSKQLVISLICNGFRNAGDFKNCIS